MNHKFKKLCALLCVTAAISTASFAHAEDLATAAVSLDGNLLSFAENAAPILYDGRTYVPFRAIFEAMGATVLWDGETKAVSAVRDNVQVAFPIGHLAVPVTTDGTMRMVTTDAPSFVREGTTYVSVRLAAQVFGATVGWDAGNATVLIVDTEKLREDYAQSFPIFDQYLAFAYPAGAHKIDFNLIGTVTLHSADGDLKVPIGAKIMGQTDGNDANLAMSVTADTASMEDMLARDSAALGEDQVRVLRAMHDGYFTAIVNRLDGLCYLKGAPLASIGVKEGSWVKLPLNELLTAVSGGSMNLGVLNGIAQADTSIIAAGLAGQTVLSSVQEGNRVRDVFESCVLALGDDAFTRVGSTYTLTKTAQDNELTQTRRLTINVSESADGFTISGAEDFTQTVDSDGKTVLESAITRDVLGGLQGSIVIASDAYDAQLTVQMQKTQTTNDFVRVPDGDIVPQTQE